MKGDGKQVVRANAGLYYARIPGLNLASSRSTDGSRGQTLFRNSALTPFLGPPPAYGDLLPVADRRALPARRVRVRQGFREPADLHRDGRATSARSCAGCAAGISYTHARTDHLTRFFNANDPVFGNALGHRPGPGRRQRDRQPDRGPEHGQVPLQRHHRRAPAARSIPACSSRSTTRCRSTSRTTTTSAIPSPSATRGRIRCRAEYNWSDRDQRHRFNAWVLAVLPGDIYLNNRVSAYSAQPASESCGANNLGTGAAGQFRRRSASAPTATSSCGTRIRQGQRVLLVGHPAVRPFNFGRQGTFEAIFEVFNVTNTDNFMDPSTVGRLQEFRRHPAQRHRQPRQFQVGGRYLF